MWELCKIANGNLSCDNGNMRSEEIPGVLKVLEQGFDVEYADKGSIDMAMVALDFFVNGKKVKIGWDCWSGIFIMPCSEKENEIIEKIYEYLSTQKPLMRSNILM